MIVRGVLEELHPTARRLTLQHVEVTDSRIGRERTADFGTIAPDRQVQRHRCPGLGNVESAIEWLTQTAEQGFPCYTSFEVDPMLDNLRRAPVGQALMHELEQRHRYFDENIGRQAVDILSS